MKTTYTLDFFKTLLAEKAINAKEYGIRLYNQLVEAKDFTHSAEVSNLLTQFVTVQVVPVQEYNRTVSSLSAAKYTRNGRYLSDLRKTGFVSIMKHPLGGSGTKISRTKKEALSASW